MSNYVKDPDAVLDYVFDWTSWLAAAETISSVVITAAVGITLNPTPKATTVATPLVTIWLGGGTEGTSYAITCRVTTNVGRVDDHTITVVVRSK